VYKVVCPERIEKKGEDILLAKGYQVVTLNSCDHERIKKEIADADAAIVRIGAHFDADILRAGKKLRIVARHGVGYDNIDVETAAQLGIYVTNARGANANAVAEHAITLMLALAKRLPELPGALVSGDWPRRNRRNTIELWGKTLGLIGLGANGRRLAEIAGQGFHMKVIGFDPYVDASSLPEYITQVGTKEAVLERSDIVSMHCLLVQDTFHCISDAELEQMKPGAWLINCARGGLVDETALYHAMKSGKIAAAGLDVYEQEPPDKDNPLFQLENFIGTLHQASSSAEAAENCSLYAAQAVDDVLNGRPPRFPVNRPNLKSALARASKKA